MAYLSILFGLCSVITLFIPDIDFITIGLGITGIILGKSAMKKEEKNNKDKVPTYAIIGLVLSVIGFIGGLSMSCGACRAMCPELCAACILI